MPAHVPLRLALAITDLKVGGAEKCLVELAARIDRTRFAPVVYSLAPAPIGADRALVDRLEAARVPMHFLDAQSQWNCLSAHRRLRDLLRAQAPHALQTFLFHANILGRLAAKAAGVPVILSGVRVAQREKRWQLWLDRWTQHGVARHVCVSAAVAQFSAREGRLPRAKLVVIPNGIDLEKYPAPRRFDAAALGIPPDRRLIACVGRLHVQKGLEWLLSTAALWLGQLPHTDLLLVGYGPLRKRLELLAEQSGLGQRIHFLDLRADVGEILAACRLLVLPSRWEGMPNVLLEAMASRLPVVATDVEGVCELLGDQAERQTVAYGDTTGFAQKVQALLDNPNLAAAVGMANRERVERQFSIERMVRAYETLFENVVGQG